MSHNLSKARQNIIGINIFYNSVKYNSIKMISSIKSIYND